MQYYAILVFLFGTAGVILIMFSLYQIIRNRKKHHWYKIQAHISAVSRSSSENQGLPLVIYDYELNNQSFQGSIAPTEQHLELEEFAKKFLEKYKIGEPIEIYVDPDQHEISCLSIAVPGEQWLILSLGFGALLTAVIIFLN